MKNAFMLFSKPKGRQLTSLVPPLVLFSALFLLQLAGCAAPSTQQDYNRAERAVKASIEETYGIQVLGIRQSAAGYMLDFRYRVIDPEKAMPFFRKEIKPYLTDQASGASLTVPVPAKVGPMRQTSGNPRADRTYFMFFGNPGKFVKVGSKVTVMVGDYRIENLTVE